MFFFLSKVLHFLLDPFIVGFLFLLLSFVWRSKANRLRIVGCGVLLVFSNNFLCDGAYRLWEMPYSDVQGGEVGIVLGGYMSFDKTTGLAGFHASSDRLLHGVRLYKQKKIGKILLSGGSGSILRPNDREAVFAKDFLMDIGIPERDIWMESTSRNTYENAVNSSDILRQKKVDRVILITSAFHMKRSAMCFKKQQIACHEYPVDFYAGPLRTDIYYLLLPNSACFQRWTMLFHEWLGCLMYWLMGYV